MFFKNQNGGIRARFYATSRVKVARVVPNVPRVGGISSLWFSRFFLGNRGVYRGLYKVGFIYGAIPGQGAYVF